MTFLFVLALFGWLGTILVMREHILQAKAEVIRLEDIVIRRIKEDSQRPTGTPSSIGEEKQQAKRKRHMTLYGMTGEWPKEIK